MVIEDVKTTLRLVMQWDTLDQFQFQFLEKFDFVVSSGT